MRFFVFAVISIFFFSSVRECRDSEKIPVLMEKINGMSLENPHSKIDTSDFRPLKDVNVTWVSVIPFAFSRQGEPTVHFNHAGQWWGEKEEGTREMIRMAHAMNLKVMLKPHVWMHGAWIGEYVLTAEEDWLEWEGTYREFIMSFAKMAQEEHVDLFCIGTELRQTVTNRPDYWKRLIAEVRTIYSGKITYASNWDDFEQVGFWSDLDYIGVNAYFPLSGALNPSEKEIADSWKPIKDRLSGYSHKFQKQILFTECGYQSINGAAGNHWEVKMLPENKNFEIQESCFDALYSRVWAEDWLAGGFVWKWHFGEHRGRHGELSFTPQDKPALQVISRWYKHYGKSAD